ncbi:MAG: porin [Rhizobacter sp.]|nr:porin [Rhizobacter sp.]
MNRKSLLALALLAGFANAASAQSSVTLFGVIDANLRQIDNNGVKVRQLGTDGLNSSRLGFRGVEDLGGGLKGSFWLEAGLNPDDGGINSSGKFWHRRSTVSLEGGFGEIRLGRDYSPTYTGISDFDAFGDNGVGKFSNLQSRLGGTVNTNSRLDNEVQYFLPKDLGGVYGSLAVAAGEGTVGNKYIGGRVGYAAGPLNVSGSYGTTDANATEDKYKIGSLGLAYNLGVVRLLGSFTQMKFLSREEKLLLIGATAPVGSGLIRASFGRADLSGGTGATRTADADDASLIAVGYVHNLSKRTALYGTYSRIANKGAQNFQVGATTPTLPNGQKSQGIEAGLRHSF